MFEKRIENAQELTERRPVAIAKSCAVVVTAIAGGFTAGSVVKPGWNLRGLALVAILLAWVLAIIVLELAGLLKKSEIRFKSLFERMSIGVGEVDVRTRKFVNVNAKLQQIYGYSLSDLRRMTFLDLTHPDDRGADIPKWDAMISGKTPSYRVEKRYIRAGGAVIWARIDAAISRRSPDGTPITTVGTVQDITAEKEVSLALERNERALRDALRARDDFASIASHELKTPVSNLLMRAELAKRGVFGCRGKDGVGDFIEAIESQARALHLLVEEMMDLARIRSGRLLLKRERFDLNDAVETVVDRMRPLLLSSAGGMPPEVNTTGDACGSWDRARIEQVLTNLLSNVVRYGAGTPAKVELDTLEGAARLQVRDRGKGIPKEDLEKIFGRFAGGAISAGRGGLGLGLYLSRKIVEAHGGTIRADSELGKGTTFVVVLPLAPRGVDAVDVAYQTTQ